MGPWQITVLAGGDSPEREISLQSGRAVAESLARRGHAVREIDPGDGCLAELDWSGCDAVLLALHGPGGEDGTVQAELQELGVPYTGCDAATSRLAFSKTAAKARFEREGVPTPLSLTVSPGFDPARLARLVADVGLPLVVKPDAQGSSLGVRLVETPSSFSSALSEAFRLGRRVMIEQAIAGTEWTVTLVDESPLPPIRISTPREFFDFEAKYSDEETRLEFPTGGGEHDAVVAAALAACRSLGTCGLVRVDLMVDHRGRPWVLEVNTIPGLTDHSLAPRAAAQAGLSLGELCERMLAGVVAPAAAGPRRWHIRQNRTPGRLQPGDS